MTLPAAASVRVMTWNIHGALGRNPGFDLDRVVALIRRHRPDIVALQEIDSRRDAGGGRRDPFAALREVVGRHGADARTITTADGDYGQMLVSRWPMSNVEVRDLSYPEREPRRAISGEVATPLGPLRVIATHLGLSLRERRSQVLGLLGLIGDLKTTTVAMGDFNDWFWVGSVRRRLGRVLPACTTCRTFPAVAPVLRLDRVFLWPRGALLSGHTDRDARLVSDHLPVVADIRVSIQERGGTS